MGWVCVGREGGGEVESSRCRFLSFRFPLRPELTDHAFTDQIANDIGEVAIFDRILFLESLVQRLNRSTLNGVE